MSSYHSLQIRHQVKGSFDDTYHALFDFIKFGELHPYMTEVTIYEDKSPLYVEYNITEEVYFLGFIPNRPRYRARVSEIEKNKHIRYTSQVKKNIYLTIDLHIMSEGNNTVMVSEDIQLKCNKLIALIFLRILKKAHTLFFEKLNDLLRVKNIRKVA